MLRLIKALEEFPEADNDDEKLERLSDGITLISFAIAERLSLQAIDIAVQIVSSDKESLRFLSPTQLFGISIPINQKTIIGKAALSQNLQIFNQMKGVERFMLLEMLKQNGKRLEPIQKIAALPLSKDSKLLGVLQLSKRSSKQENAGQDFQQLELLFIRPLVKALSRHLQRFCPSSF